MLEPPQIFALDRDHMIAAWRDIMILEWCVETTLAAVKEQRQLLGRFVAARPVGSAMFAIVHADASLPAADARAHMATTLRDYGRNLQGSSIVIEGEGFRAAALRSVITGLSLLSRTEHPHRIFGDVDNAATWLAKVCGQRLAQRFEAPELVAAIAVARESCVLQPPAAAL